MKTINYKIRIRLSIISLLFIFLLPLSAQRKVSLINNGWKFSIGDAPQAQRLDFDDSSWHRVGLPHSFSIPYFESKQFYVGYGWYRKTLSFTPEELKDKSIMLAFDGVFQETEVYVNGRLAGSHRGGYTGFCIPITTQLHVGENLIAVRVNNLWRADLAPRAGEHTFSGGIYRDVRLVITDKTHIAWCGQWLSSPDLETNHGTAAHVQIEADIINASDETSRVMVISDVLDASGKVVATAKSMATIGARGKTTLRDVSSVVKRPKLWSPDAPYLYQVRTRVMKGRQICDEVESEYGFRWVRWTADHGFFLNGRHVYLRGANVHQDQAGWGDAMCDSAAWRDVKMVKDAGLNFIRGSHYPHSPAFVHACNMLGVMFWSEAPFWGTYGDMKDGYWTASAYPVNPADTTSFDENTIRQLQEMIAIHRNSPSIIAWSMCNEVFFTADGTLPGVRRLLKKMVNATHAADTTRPAAIGGCQRPTEGDRLDKLGDVAGYNGDGATIKAFIDPGIPNMVTEYGSTIDVRPGKYAPGWGDLEKGHAYRGVEWRSGQAIWCAFDHGTLATGDFGRMGFIDYQRLPKRRWYWYRNEYLGVAPPAWPKPGTPAKLALKASKTTGVKADGTEDVQLVVTVLDAHDNEISNCPDVTLRRVCGPGEFPTGNSITFRDSSDIYIRDGKAAINYRSYYAGQTVIEATSPGLQPARLTLTFLGDSAYVEGMTPPTEDRPYVRFTNVKAKEILWHGKGNPTFSSSMLVNHLASMAADGDSATYWRSDAKDKSPVFTIDLERYINLGVLSLTFPQIPEGKIAVSTSATGESWEQLEVPIIRATHYARDFSSLHREVRFIRLSFSHSQAALSEISVSDAKM